jgi:autotransporter family porin
MTLLVPPELEPLPPPPELEPLLPPDPPPLPLLLLAPPPELEPLLPPDPPLEPPLLAPASPLVGSVPLEPQATGAPSKRKERAAAGRIEVIEGLHWEAGGPSRLP